MEKKWLAGYKITQTHIERQTWSGRNDRGLRPTVSEKNYTRKNQIMLPTSEATQEVSMRYRVSLNCLPLSIKGNQCN